MKKLATIVLSAALIMSLAACGAEKTVEESSAASSVQVESSVEVKEESKEESSEADVAPASSEVKEEVESSEEASVETNGETEVDANSWLATKTGKFFKQFETGEMYWKLISNVDGEDQTLIMAVKDDKMTVEVTDAQMGTVSIIVKDGSSYIVSHAEKMAVKYAGDYTQDMNLDLSALMVDSDEKDVTALKTGKVEVDGVEYDAEIWAEDEIGSAFYFQGDTLKYMVTMEEGDETRIKVEEYSNKVDDALFEVPGDYTILEM